MNNRQMERDDLFACLDIIHQEIAEQSRVGLAYYVEDIYGMPMYVVLGPDGNVAVSSAALWEAIERLQTLPDDDRPISTGRLYELCAANWLPVEPYSNLELLAKAAE